jgi:hypothetical protein
MTKKLIVLTLTMFLGAACAVEDEAGTLDESPEDVSAPGKADGASISATPLVDAALVPGKTAVHKVFTSQAAYSTFFGHEAPAGVDFRGQWVIYYDAGTQPTGATVTIDGIGKSSTGKTLEVAVSVTPSCAGDAAVPYVLATIHKQPGATYSRFTTDLVAEVCPSDPGTCDVTDRCPGVGTCISRTWDSCTPNKPGCEGVCACMPSDTSCPEGEHWDGSVSVCGCVPGID